MYCIPFLEKGNFTFEVQAQVVQFISVHNWVLMRTTAASFQKRRSGDWVCVPVQTLLQARWGRWLHLRCCCCCCWLCSALELCLPPLRPRGTLTANSPCPWSEEWIWPWRSSTLTPQSNNILSSSGACPHQRSRYSPQAGISRVVRYYRRLSFLQTGFGVAFIYHHFQLKATTCPKRTADVSGCRHRNDRVSVFSSTGMSARNSCWNLHSFPCVGLCSHWSTAPSVTKHWERISSCSPNPTSTASTKPCWRRFVPSSLCFLDRLATCPHGFQFLNSRVGGWGLFWKPSLITECRI